MRPLARPVAIALASFCAFINLYAPQSLLPLVAREFGVGAVESSRLISSTTLAVALIAPFTGAVADMLGRKRVIVVAMFALLVPTVMVALAPTLGQMVVWRFVQGLLLPPVFVVTVAYIGDELPPAHAAGMAGLYTAASCFGGFFGRFFAGVLAGPFGMRGAFLGMALVTLAAAIGVLLLLPRERNFVPSRDFRTAMRHMIGHAIDPDLAATFAVGFGVLFNFVALFTYISFHLAAPPFGLSAAALGTIFVVYLSGVFTTPLTGRLVRRFGRRNFVLAAMAVWVAGLALTLSGSLAIIILGLVFASGAGFFCQATSTGYIAVSARRARSSAVGLYVTAYYVGGSFGALLPGYAWNWAGWPGVIAVILVMLAIIAAMVLFFWREPEVSPPAPSVSAG